MNTLPLSEADLDRLEVLLECDAFDGEAFRLDEIQAMLCAVVSGPQPVMPAVWLAEALGPGLDKADQPEVGETVELLMRLNNQIARALLEDESVAPLLYPLDEDSEEYDFAAWADGYIVGANLGGDWYEIAGKHAEDLSELLQPLFLLNGMLKEDVENSGERWFPPAEEERMIADVQENLPLIVQTLYNFWRNKREGGKKADESGKTGRNDPCPCGSGKKYKQCCASPGKLN